MSKNFIDKFNLLVGVLVLCATVFGLWYQSSDKSLELTLDLLSVDELTELTKTPYLKASFKYNDVDVTHLWKATFRIQNTGDKVIIGKGSQSNLLEKSIPITFGQNFKIIDLETTYNDLSLVTNVNGNTINSSFEQWRQDELSVISIYLEAIGDETESPMPKVMSRSLINGSIEVNNLSSVKGVTQKEPRVVFPQSILDGAKFIFSLFIFLCVLIAIIVLIGNTPEFIKMKIWKKKNTENFNKYLDGLGVDIVNEEMISYLTKKYKSSPEETPDFIWSGFKGQQLETSSINNTYRGVIAVSATCLIIILSATVVILGT